MMKVTYNRVDRLERIIDTQARLVQANLDLGAFMQLVVDTLQELTEAKGAVVELVDGDEMVYRAASRSIAEHIGLRLPRSGSFSGLCVSTAAVLRCDDADTDVRVNAVACRKVGVRSMICAPLFDEGVPIGVLKVMSDRANGFDDEDVQTLSLLTAALGAALSKQVSFDNLARVEKRLRSSEARLSAMLEYANDAVISMNEGGQITQWNRAAEQLFGWPANDILGSKVVDTVVPHADRVDFERRVASMITSGAWAGLNFRQEVMAQHRAGHALTLECSLGVTRLDGQLEFTAFLHDISERKQMEQTLRDMALTDALTGLANRRAFIDALMHATAFARRQETGVALLYMDLNDFKLINDVHGHEMGDVALKTFAERLASCVRASDIVARLGGDEFTVLAEGIHSTQHAEVLAQKIIASLAMPLPGTDITLATSIGISLYTVNTSGQDLLREADAAMYQAKQGGAQRNRVAIYRGSGDVVITA